MTRALLMRVVARHFVAGLLIEGGRVVQAAPILMWTRGKTLEYVSAYCARKGWRIAECELA